MSIQPRQPPILTIKENFDEDAAGGAVVGANVGSMVSALEYVKILPDSMKIMSGVVILVAVEAAHDKGREIQRIIQENGGSTEPPVHASV